MKRLFLKIAIAFCLFPLSLHAQQTKLLFHHLTIEDGLSEHSNLFVYKDSRGFVWISSVIGLNRFDGSQVKIYLPDPNDTTSLNGENIQSNFYEDPGGNIWFCTYTAINCYDPLHDNFRHYTVKDQFGEALPGYYVFFLDARGDLWFFLEGKGLYTFNIETKIFQFRSPLRLYAIRAQIIEKEPGKIKTIYAYRPGYPGLEEFSFDDGGKIIHHSVHHLASNGHEINPRKIISHGDSVLWISSTGSLVEYEIKSAKTVSHSIPGMITFEKMNDSAFLVSVDEQGVWEFNIQHPVLKNQHRHVPENRLSLLSDRVNYMSADRDGIIWLSSTENGMSYTYAGKNKFTITSPPAGNISMDSKFSPVGVCEMGDNRIVCANSVGGIDILNREGSILEELPWPLDQLSPGKIKIYKILKDSQYNTWLSTYEGLAVIPANTKKIVFLTNQDRVMWDGVELKDGRLIFGAQPVGLFEVQKRNDQWSLHRIDSLRLNNEYLPVRQDSKGMIWLSDRLQKLILLDPSSFDISAEIAVKGVITNLVEDPMTNTIWLSGNTGLYEIDRKTYAVRNAYNEVDGLGLTGFNSMLQDDQGLLWLSCRNNIAAFNPVTKKFRVFREEDGMPRSQFNLYGAYEFNDGEMWFGMAGGLLRFYPDQIKNIHLEAIPQITGILINDVHPEGKLICEKNQATNICAIEKLIFSYLENTLSFVVNSLEYSAPSQNRVQYKMEGVDNDWIEVKSGTLVRYPALPAGNFIFNVKAANSDGIYSENIRQLDITITPPFYKTWWFILLSCLAFIALIVYIVYLNFSKTIELQKVRLRLYENLHDDVGSRLTAIVLSAEDLAQNEKYANPKLVHISHIAKSIVNNMRRLVWAIDPENDSMNSLAAKIRHDKNLILDDKIEFSLDIPRELNDMVIPGEIRYQLTSIINEALTNTSKYAQASHVWVSFSKSDRKLMLRIRDDGIGFNMDDVKNDKTKATGYGFGNMQKRISRIKGTLSIHSVPDKGTTLEATIPVS